MGAEQAEANRLFRTHEADEYTAPLARRARTPEDVTAGLGLDLVTERRVQQIVTEQRADFSKKGATQRSFLAANGLVETLRRIDVPADTRMEITKRARAFWQNTQPTDYSKEPTVRARQGTQMRSNAKVHKSGVRYVRPLSKALPNKKPAFAPPAPVPGGGAAKPPPLPSPAPAMAAPASAANVRQPPSGYAPIPNSKIGGYRMKAAKGWTYWYPGAGLTSTPHPADAGKARAQRAAGESAAPVKAGKGAKPPKPAAGPPGAPAAPTQAGAGPPAPAGPPAAPGGAPKPPAAPPHPAGAAPPQAGAAPPQAGAAPGPSGGAPQAAGAPQATGPSKANAQAQVTKDHTGEKRQFHPEVQAHTPAGKENDQQHHADEFQRHRAERAAAMRGGDQEKAKAHTFAMNFHADKHNRLRAASQGKDYKPKGTYPGADAGEDGMGGGADTVAASYDRAGKPGKDGKSSSAADPRERFVPESKSVSQMRETLGKAVNIMADLSQAHDHLSALKAKRLEAKRSGHPLARRMISQIDAEVAATKHDIVQLEDAHGHAMKEVLAHQSLLRNERIRANPIFRAFMNAMQSLSGLSDKIGAKLGEKAGQALEGAKGAVEDFKNRGAKAEQDAARGQLDSSLAAAGEGDDPENGEVKPLGVTKDDIAAQYGDPEAEEQGQARTAEAMDVLKKLGQAQGDEPQDASADDVESIPDDEAAAAGGDDAGGESEADGAIKDIFGMRDQREQQGAANKQRAEESAGFDRELASARNKRDAIEQKAAAQADHFEQRNKGRSEKSVMRESLGGGDEDTQVASGVRKKQAPSTREQSTVSVTGAKRKQAVAVEKSMRLVKSAQWQAVMRLAPKLDNTLRKSTRYVAPLAHVARAPMTFLDLYGG